MPKKQKSCGPEQQIFLKEFLQGEVELLKQERLQASIFEKLKNLSADEVASYLEGETAGGITEVGKFKFLMRWLQADMRNRSAHITQLHKHVDFGAVFKRSSGLMDLAFNEDKAGPFANSIECLKIYNKLLSSAHAHSRESEVVEVSSDSEDDNPEVAPNVRGVSKRNDGASLIAINKAVKNSRPKRVASTAIPKNQVPVAMARSNGGGSPIRKREKSANVGQRASTTARRKPPARTIEPPRKQLRLGVHRKSTHQLAQEPQNAVNSSKESVPSPVPESPSARSNNRAGRIRESLPGEQNQKLPTAAIGQLPIHVAGEITGHSSLDTDLCPEVPTLAQIGANGATNIAIAESTINGDETDNYLFYANQEGANRRRFLYGFNWKTKQSTQLSKFERPREYSSSILIGNEVYDLGGAPARPGIGFGDMSPGSKCVEIFGIGENRYHRLGKPMLVSRKEFSVSVVDNYLYVVAGCYKLNVYDACEKFNLTENATGTWVRIASLQNGRGGHTSAVVDKKIFAIGGIGSANRYLNSVEVYDTSEDVPRWKPWAVSHFKTPRGRHASTVMDNKIYILGGETKDEERLKSGEVYNPELDTWTDLPDMKHTRLDFGLFEIDGRLWAICGNETGKGMEGGMEAYDPREGRWDSIPWNRGLRESGKFCNAIYMANS